MELVLRGNFKGHWQGRGFLYRMKAKGGEGDDFRTMENETFWSYFRLKSRGLNHPRSEKGPYLADLFAWVLSKKNAYAFPYRR